MRLLAFDTATDICSVAVWTDGQVRDRCESGRRHAERLLVLIDEVLADTGSTLAGIDAVAFGRGPGSFTGVRISAGVAQGIAFGRDIPVVPISSLAALAQSVDATHVLAALDARMQQVYWGAYSREADGLVRLSGEEIVAAPAAVPVPTDSEWVGAGNGWEQYGQVLTACMGERLQGWRSDHYPSARGVALLGARVFGAGGGVAPEQALPVYLRDNVAVKKHETQK